MTSFPNVCSPLLERLRTPYGPRKGRILENLLGNNMLDITVENYQGSYGLESQGEKYRNLGRSGKISEKPVNFFLEIVKVKEIQGKILNIFHEKFLEAPFLHVC